MSCIWITVLQKLICEIKVAQYLLFFPDWPADIESDWQAQCYSYSSVHSYPSQSGGWLSVMGLVASRVASSSPDGMSAFSPLGSSRGGSADILLYHWMPTLLHIGNTTTSGGFVVECLQPSLNVSGKLCIFSSCISCFWSVQVSDRTCQRSTKNFDSGGTMVGGVSLVSNSSQHVGIHSLALSYHKRCFSRPPDQESSISAFKPLAAQRCVLCRLWFSLSVCQAGVGATQASVMMVYLQCWKE